MAQAYTNLAGSGPRSAATGPVVVMSTNIALGAGNIQALVDGDTSANNVNNSLFWSATASNVGSFVQWQFPRPTIQTKLKLYQSAATAQGDWKIQGSTNGTVWVDIVATFTWSTTPQEVVMTNAVAYTYYRILGINGTFNSGPWINEFEFEVNSGGTFERGNRAGIVTATSAGLVLGSGPLQNMFDGVETGAAGMWATNRAAAGATLTFVLSSTAVLTGLVWMTDPNSDAWGTWKVQGSNDGSAWTDLAASITIGGVGAAARNTAQIFTWTNTVSYTQYRMLGLSGTIAAAASWQNEILLMASTSGGGGGGVPTGSTGLKYVRVIAGPTGPTGTFEGVNILSAFTGPTGTFAVWNQLAGPTGPTGTFKTVYPLSPTGDKGRFKTVIIPGYSGPS